MEKFIADNLDYWKDKKWKIDYNKLKGIHIKINNKNIEYKYIILKKNHRFTFVKKILNKVTTYKNNLNVSFILSFDDEYLKNKHKIYNFSDKVYKNNNKLEYKFGICKNDENIMKIEEGKIKNCSFPIFTFNKIQDGMIIFPHKNILNNFKFDLNNFETKKDNIIYRYSNIRANLFLDTRIKLTELSYKNPYLFDFKGGYNDKNPYHNNYILPKVFLKYYKHKKIIDENINEDKFIEYFNVNNYIKKDELINNKFLICCDSWYNGYEYSFTNSILFRYKLDKAKYYEDFFLEGNKDYIIFDENNLEEKYNYVKNNLDYYKDNIKNRHEKVKDYLTTEKIAEFYGNFLEEYSKLQKTNEINLNKFG